MLMLALPQLVRNKVSRDSSRVCIAYGVGTKHV